MNVAVRRVSSITPGIEIRLATVDDVKKIVPFLGAFFARSRWAEQLTFKPESALKYLAHAITSGFAPYVLAFDGDELVGCCSYHIYNVFTEPIAVMDETYVVPRLRRTDLARRLVFLALECARADNCKIMNFPVSSGMPEQQGLINMLMKHFGCENMGVLLRKVL